MKSTENRADWSRELRTCEPSVYVNIAQDAYKIEIAIKVAYKQCSANTR